MTNDVFEESGKHYITLFVSCRRMDEVQEPEVRLFFYGEVVEEWELTWLTRRWSRRSARVGSGRAGRMLGRWMREGELGPSSSFFCQLSTC